VFLELRPSPDFRLSFSTSTVIQSFIPQGGISLQLENDQFKYFLTIILLEFNDPLNGLNLISVVLRFVVTIQLRFLNLEVTKIISKRTSPFNTLLFMVFMRRGVDHINGVVIKLPMVRCSALGSFNPFKLHGELPYLLLKSDNDIIPPYFMSLLKGQTLRLRRFSFIGHCWK